MNGGNKSFMDEVKINKGTVLCHDSDLEIFGTPHNSNHTHTHQTASLAASDKGRFSGQWYG